MQLIVQSGYAGCSVAAVADRAGVGTGTIYRFFPSKGELLAEVFRHTSSREVAAVSAAGAEAQQSGSRRVAILASVRAFCLRALAAPKLAYALLAEPVDPLVAAERLAFHDAYTDLLASTITVGIAEGELAEQDPRVSGAAIVGAISDALISPLSRGATDPAVVESLLGFVDRSLGYGSDFNGDSSRDQSSPPARRPRCR